MIYKCIALSSQMVHDEETHEDKIVFDFEFEGADGSGLYIANSEVSEYELGKDYDLFLVSQEETANAQ